MQKPSSTITAAFLAGIAASVFWETVATFTEIEPSAGLMTGSTTLIAGLVGYFKKEKVIK